MDRDHLVLLREASELISLMSRETVDAFLQRIVVLLNTHIRADVASVYLYTPVTRELVLRATRGLSPDSVGRVRLRLGEGLVGHVLKTLEPLCEKAASRNPRFKRFAGINEEHYESFLAVPLHRGAERLGVLVAQRREEDFFGPRDLLALQALASQLANAVDNARLLSNTLPRPNNTEAKLLPQLVHGRVLSEGYASGPAVHIDTVHSHRRLAAGPFETRYTPAEFHTALKATDGELSTLQRRFASDLPELATLIFTAHQMMLMDAQFAGEMASRVQQGENPPDAIVTVARECMARFAAHPEGYIRDKAADVEDLAARLLNKLLRKAGRPHTSCAGGIIIAHALYPSDVIELYAQKIKGIILARGGDTSHVVLLARSLGVPLVIANHHALFAVREGTPLLLDAEIGNVYIEPTEPVLTRFRARNETQATAMTADMKSETRTRSGARVHLLANINLLSEARLACRLKAEGVGLYRSEFPFLVRSAFPSEEEQVVIYRRLIHEMQGRPVTVRTLDLGGDKTLARHGGQGEDNPQLGLRSIRFSLQHPDLFHLQLRAILRGAAGAADLRILFPMIGGLEEFRAARQAVNSAAALLAHEGLPHYRKPLLGMMVELPSVVPLMDEFAREVDFFSIGTNDFVQYTLGVDRGNEKVSSFYRADHPAVLRAIQQVVKVVRRYGRDLSVCGEMAHERRFVPFFIGIGVRALSVDPRYLPALQAAIQCIDVQEAEALARRVLACSSIEDVKSTLAEFKDSVRQIAIPEPAHQGVS